MRDWLAYVERHSLIDVLLDLDLDTSLGDDTPPARAPSANTSPWATSSQRRQRRTCCPMGHPYTATNTYSDGRSQICRTCKQQRRRKVS